MPKSLKTLSEHVIELTDGTSVHLEEEEFLRKKVRKKMVTAVREGFAQSDDASINADAASQHADFQKDLKSKTSAKDAQMGSTPTLAEHVEDGSKIWMKHPQAADWNGNEFISRCSNYV